MQTPTAVLLALLPKRLRLFHALQTMLGKRRLRSARTCSSLKTVCVRHSRRHRRRAEVDAGVQDQRRAAVGAR